MPGASGDATHPNNASRLISASGYNSGIYAVPAATLVHGRLSASVLIDDRYLGWVHASP